MTKSKKQPKDTEVVELKEQLEREQAAKVQVMADFENYRKRIENEKAKYGLMASMSILSTVLDVTDDIALAQKDEGLDLERAKEVISILNDKLLAIANSSGLEKVEVKPGDDFDPSFMEAITQIPAPEERLQGKVVDVISNAFRHTPTGEIIKTAKVIVGK